VTDGGVPRDPAQERQEGAGPARLLFLIDELDVGGTEQQLLELVKRLDRAKYLPVVCCFRPGRVAKEIAAAGVKLVALRKRAKVDPGLVLALLRLMRRERVDLVQTFLFTANTWGRLAAVLAGVPIILSSERNVDMWEERYKALVGRWLDRWTRCTVANSEAVKEYLVGKGLRPEKIRVIYNGVDCRRFDGPRSPDALRTELGIPPRHSVVGLLARLEPQKDPHTFLRAAAQIAAEIPAVSFLVVGGGGLEAGLKREAARLGLGGRIIFTGPRRDVGRVLAACDLSVLSSLKEGMSNTILESMAAGLPVVATRVGGNAELIQDGETGFLVPPRDPARLAEAIGRLLREPSLAKAMGMRAGERVAQRFSVDVMVESTTRLYDELIGSARIRPSPVSPEPARDGRRDGRLALVVSQFPRYVDAYFLREIAALAARGIQFRIFSLRNFDGKVIHEQARPFLGQTVYIPFLFSWRLLQAQARALGRSPRRYLGALLTVIAGSWRSARALATNLAIFPKSVYFAELVRDDGMPHVHANWATHPATAAMVISRLADAPWSFAGHASDIYLHTTMLAEKIRAAKFVVTCTRYNREYLAGVGGEGTAQKIFVSYHGVDLERFRPAPGRSADGFRILAVGTLLDCKGFDDLIQACSILLGKGVSFDCTIAGDGRERRPLERLIRRLELMDRVRITGYVSQEALIPLYQNAGVVALPARAEGHFGIPNVLLEALAVGTPVVCTRLPSLPELMEDGVHGLYVPERAPRALADALETLARDPERRRIMGEAGRQRVEMLFDTEKNVAVLENLFRAARGTPAPGSEAGTIRTKRVSHEREAVAP
jgi:glycosyltransferase involved in cell wall biosynthesis